MPRVSVPVPAYDAEETIAETLASVLAQTERDIEVVVVDDGSRDRTAAIVEQIAQRDRRLRLLQQRNAGVSAARNAAIAASSGEFVAPMDADDLWAPDKLERQLARFASAKPRAAPIGLVYAWSTIVDAETRTIGRATPWRVEGSVLPVLICFHFIGSGSCPLIPRRVIEEVGGYDAGLRAAGADACEDWDLALRIADRYEFAVAPAYLVSYRRRPQSMSSDGGKMWRGYQQVMARVAAAHPDLPPVLWRWSRSRFQHYLAGIAYEASEVASGLRWTGRAVRSDPVMLLSSGPFADLGSAVRSLVRPARLAVEARWPGRLDATLRRRRAPRGEAHPSPAWGEGTPLPWERDWLPYQMACRRRWAEAQRYAARRGAGAMATGDRSDPALQPATTEPARTGSEIARD